MSARLAAVVFTKEVVDNLRDRRAVAMAFLFPLLPPLVLFLTLDREASRRSEAEDSAFEVAAVGAERAPELVRFLGQDGVTLVRAPDDVEAAVRDGRIEGALVIPADLESHLRAGEPAPVQLVVDEGRDAARPRIERLRRLLVGYGRTIGSLRLLARGVSPSVPDAIVVEAVDVSTVQGRAGILLGMLPYYLMLALFVSGFYIALDTTVGERERQSLEPLLVNPVPRPALVLGKLAAAAVFVAAGLLLELGAFALAPRVVSLERLGIVMRLDPGVLARVFLLMLPLLLFACALEMAVAARARSLRQAQASLSLVVLVPIVPGMVLSTMQPRFERWMTVVPTLGESLLVGRMVRGEPVAALDAALCIAAELVYAALLVAATVRAFSSARVLAGR